MTIGAIEACVFLFVCVSAVKKRSVRPCDAIIVPGCRVLENGQPSTALLYRLQAAYDAWQRGIAPSVIVCGARGSDEPMPEGEAMKKWLVQKGVPEKRVFADVRSRNTIENMKYAAQIMKENGFRTAAVATSDYHLARTLFLARKRGIEASGIPVPGGRRVCTRLTGRVRETISLTLLFFRMIFRPSLFQ